MFVKKQLCFLGIFCAMVLPGHAQKAFPEAEGFGAQTVGGRGGRVIEVTNLNDDGPGSFRVAVTASGPRTVIFRTGGTIVLLSPLSISEPFLTVAGQTAPGGGITIRSSSQIDFGGEGSINDVIVRFVRFRYDITNGSPNNDVVNVGGHNIIFDHCSFSWGTDETFSITGHNMTVQWCVISESLTKGSAFSEGAHHLSIHHNLWAHHHERSPKMRGEPLFLDGAEAVFDFVNNVVYNWTSYGTGVAGSSHANVVNNFYKAGPDTPPPTVIAEIARMQDDCVMSPFGCVHGTGRQIYVSGNVGPSCSVYDCSDQWNSVMSDLNGVRGRNKAVDTAHLVPPVTTSTADQTFSDVLDKAGVTVPARDEVDLRIINEVKSGTGQIITGDPTVLNGWPMLAPGTPPSDSDHDGLADDWELTQFNTLDRDGTSDYDGNGYTDLEEYLNMLALSPPPPSPGPTPGVVCSLSVDKPIALVGETVTFQVFCNVNGLRVFYSGAKNGINDLSDFEAGVTPLTTSWVAKQGGYTRSVVLKDLAGNVVCITNGVTVSVNPAPVPDGEIPSETPSPDQETPSETSSHTAKTGLSALLALPLAIGIGLVYQKSRRFGHKRGR